MIVCHCENVSHRQVDAAVVAGAREVDDVTRACAAGGNCGQCHDAIEDRIAIRRPRVLLRNAS